MRTHYDVILEPIVSEKSYDMIEKFNTYTFLVDPRASKEEIRDAVQALFEVKVLKVNTMNRRGKRIRYGYRHGKRKDTKRALVTLAEGNAIDLFGV
jgi:large subunit ribosomal protein L23